MSALFGFDQSSRLVFVSEVPRGLACQCTCVVCQEPLIARQGTVREHHFAHASGREPCDVGHESLLHRYAKQVIQDAGGLTVPMPGSVASALGLATVAATAVHLSLPSIEAEKALGDLRPDLLGHTDLGMAVAIEVAYSSFCDMLKIEAFARMGLPALEIDLRAFTPEAFDPTAVKQAVLEAINTKAWLWPGPEAPQSERPLPATPLLPTAATPKGRLPEELVTIAGRWVSVKTFESGDIAVKVVRFDPDLVSLVKSIAKANWGTYSPKWKTWNVPRWRAEIVRAALREKAATVSIVLKE